MVSKLKKLRQLFDMWGVIDVSFKPRQILYHKRTYLRVKKESGNQRESTRTNLVAIFEDNHSNGPKEQYGENNSTYKC